ncbi:hypothetical protein ACEQ8H_001432 [Pleosporales sp. CAS-2024a]
MKLGYFGWRQEDVPADYNPSPGLELFYVAQLFYNPILALVKCSILVFVLRIGRRRPRLPCMVYSVIAITVLQAIAVFFAVVFQCLPIAASWDAALRPTAKCIDVSFYVIMSIVTVLTDLMVLALPFYVFLGLQIGRGAKVAVLCCFGSGAVHTVSGIDEDASVTAVSIARIESLVRFFYFPGGDPFYDIKIVYSIIEPNLAIATACAPALRPLLKYYLPSIFGRLHSADTATTYGNSTMHTRNKSSRVKMALEMEAYPYPYGQKNEFRRDAHAELASIASSQEPIAPKEDNRC